MKQAFRDYFQKIGLTSEARQKRLFELYHVATRFFPEEIGDVFISQTDDEKGAVGSGDSLWFFSKNHCLEAREFLDRNDFEIHDTHGLQNLRVIAENFDLQKFATDNDHGAKATMIVEFNPPRGGRSQLHAYGQNCAKLAAVALEYLTPSINE